jgi:hypothetical protein
VPDEMWLTYLPLDAAAAELDYDLAISTDPGDAPSLVDAGLVAPGQDAVTEDVLAARRVDDSTGSGNTTLWLAAGAIAVVIGGFGIAAVALTARERRARA